MFITGGHFSPALAIIEEMQKRSDVEVFYLGRKYAMEDDAAIALEYREIGAVPGVSYLVVNSGRLQRKFFVDFFQSVKAMAKIFVGLGQTFYYFLRFKPDVVLSFGSYVAVPAALIAWFLGIPVVTHEQTVVSGLASRIIGRLSEKILVSWPDSLREFPGRRVVLTGNPIRRVIVEAKVHREGKRRGRTIYVTGGNQGSHLINLAVEAVVGRLLESFFVTHQTGDAKFRDFERLRRWRESLPAEKRKRYTLAKFIGGTRIGEVLAKSDLVIGRPGANLVTELYFLGIAAILIPIAWVERSEQEANAANLAKVGLAKVIFESELTPECLLEEIGKRKEWFAPRPGKQERERILHAAQRICHEIDEYLGPK